MILLILLSSTCLAQKRTDFKKELNALVGFKELGVKKVEIINNLIREESGNGLSRNAKRLNNYTGMRCVTKRKTTAIGCDTNGFAIYKSRIDSFRDLGIWLKLYTKPHWTDKQLLNYLRKVYAKDKNYLKDY